MLVYFLHMVPIDGRSDDRWIRLGRLSALALAIAWLSGPAFADGGNEEPAAKLDSELRVTGMTFVGTRGGSGDFVLKAEKGFFEPNSRLAHLEDVHVAARGGDPDDTFEVTCERGEFNVDTNDFLAEGDVHGSTGDGSRYTAPWVRYDREQDLLYTDAQVVMRDSAGTFRGDGFRYFLKERRFRLLGNVRVVSQ
jgi:LPS export ABC transporter protein LptC